MQFKMSRLEDAKVEVRLRRTFLPTEDTTEQKQSMLTTKKWNQWLSTNLLPRSAIFGKHSQKSCDC